MFPSLFRRARVAAAVTVFTVAATVPAVPAPVLAHPAGISVSTSGVRGSDGQYYSVTNHVRRHLPRPELRRKWLLVWAGDAGPGASTPALHGGRHREDPAAVPGPDFVAVVDATPGSPTFGTVVNTATLAPLRQMEPHHMQYLWHKGDTLYAGGILADVVFAFDATRLPELRLSGVTLSADTPCGSAPDAFWVLKDKTAYASYMGGPDVTGPCRYTNGQVRVGNGFAGSPGEVVRLAPDGRVLAEIPALPPGGDVPAARCTNVPALEKPACANPHGIQVREDLNRMVVSDFAEIRNYFDPVEAILDPYLVRDTVRIFDITNRNNPRLVSVSRLPDGPRTDAFPVFDEPRIVMENAVTHQRHHRGAFASTMFGGAVYYTPDITVERPEWREVFDDTTAYRRIDPLSGLTGGGDGGSWVAVTPDDRFLIKVVMGVHLGVAPEQTYGMVYTLDIGKLLASGGKVRCRIDDPAEVAAGGAERDCPSLVSAVPIPDPSTGGPHWGAMDHFQLGRDGHYHESRQVPQVAVANYFVSKLASDGNHKVCMFAMSPRGALTPDPSFRDEYTGEPCLDFNREQWPHGAWGDAKPHGVLFAVGDRDLR